MHTLGKWTVGKDKPPHTRYYVITNNAPRNREGGFVCQVTDWEEKESLANATLIAAAPELLEALHLFHDAVGSLTLENLAGKLNDPRVISNIVTAAGVAKQALARATGEERHE